ncbi:MAG: hypothetical protein R2939_11010 [Kofleriaceae bacterium]
MAACKEKIQALRTELLELAGREAVADRIVQINFQLFPLAVVAETPAPESDP